MESILNSCKEMLGIDPDELVFDQELIIHINSSFSVLHQLGVGTQEKSQFKIKDATATWTDFISGGTSDVIEMVKTYVYLKLRLVFDPPAHSFAISSFEDQAKELEWRLCVEADPTKLINSGSGNSGSSGSTGDCTPTLKDDLTASIGAGGIQIGDKFIKNTELEALWRALLDPVKAPTLTPPSASITASGGLLMETGSSKEVTFIVNFDRGSIDPPNGTSGYRSGEATSYTFNGVTDLTSNHFTETVSESNKTFSASVDYAEGEQPKDSKGNDVDAPLAAGYVSAQPVTFEFVDAIWSNQKDITKIEKEPLVSKSKKSLIFNFAPQTKQNPEIFDVPASWNLTKLEVLNEITERFEDNRDEFTVSTVYHQNGGGTDVEYRRYTDRRGYAADTRQIKITWE